MQDANSPLPPFPPQQSSTEDDFEDECEAFFATLSDDGNNSYSINSQAPTDPVCLRFDSFYAAIRYLSSQPFPITDLSQYAVVFPLCFWQSFPRSHKLDKVPCNLIKIQ